MRFNKDLLEQKVNEVNFFTPGTTEIRTAFLKALFNPNNKTNETYITVLETHQKIVREENQKTILMNLLKACNSSTNLRDLIKNMQKKHHLYYIILKHDSKWFYKVLIDEAEYNIYKNIDPGAIIFKIADQTKKDIKSLTTRIIAKRDMQKVIEKI